MITPLKLQLILKDISQAEIARAAGVQRAYVNRVVLGRQKPSKRVVEAFKQVADINLERGEQANAQQR